jgi:hypothetical protein
MGAGVHHQGAKSRRRAHRHRLRMRRMMLAKSQEKLGDALGVTFQQVQKSGYQPNRRAPAATDLPRLAGPSGVLL